MDPIDMQLEQYVPEEPVRAPYKRRPRRRSRRKYKYNTRTQKFARWLARRVRVPMAKH